MATTAQVSDTSSLLEEQAQSYGATSSGSVSKVITTYGRFFGRVEDGSKTPRTIGEAARNFLDGRSAYGRYFDGFIVTLILLNVACLIIHPDERGTMITWAHPANRSMFFDSIEAISVGVFTLEYLLRFVFATEDRGPRKTNVLSCGKKAPYVFTPFQRTQLIARARYVFSIWSFIDLATILPFYIDIALPGVDIPSVQFIRVARLLRVFRPEGRFGAMYAEVQHVLLDKLHENRQVWYTALFIGGSIWIVCSALYYVTERHNPKMMWMDYGDCEAKGTCVNRMGSIPSAMYFCLVNMFGEYPLADEHSDWGKVVCSFVAVVAVFVFAIPAGLLGKGFELAGDEMEKEQNRLDEIAAAEAASRPDVFRLAPQLDVSVQATVYRLFWPDEFLSGDAVFVSRDDDDEDTANSDGVHGVIVATPHSQQYQYEVAVDIPATNIAADRVGLQIFVDKNQLAMDDVSQQLDASDSTSSSLASCTPPVSRFLGNIFASAITLLILLNVLSVIIDSIQSIKHGPVHHYLGIFEVISVAIFTAEYLIRFFAVGANTQYSGWKRLSWMFTFYALIDMASIVPFYVNVAFTGSLTSSSTFVRCFRLLRLLKAAEYVDFIEAFDKTLRSQGAVLVVTASLAAVVWILSSAMMYYTERDNPDTEMSRYYQNIPSSMWITLLNLSGECPLCDFTAAGKVITGCIGIFAVGLFGVPIGIFESGFVQWAKDMGEDLEDDDDDDDDDDEGDEGDENGGDVDVVAKTLYDPDVDSEDGGSFQRGGGGLVELRRSFAAKESHSLKKMVFDILDGRGFLGRIVEFLIFFLIFLTVVTACLGTVDSLKVGVPNEIMDTIEGAATIIFTIEYVLRLWSSSEDPDFAWCIEQESPVWFHYMFSFYALIDIIAIVPFYIGLAHLISPATSDYLRMLRILRLLKLDKYVPSVSLVDDVFRNKARAFEVTGIVIGIVWIVFATLLYATTKDDHIKFDSLTMAQRYHNIPNSFQYAFIHLSGDYPLVDYTFWGRIVNVFIILIAVAVVGVPFGLVSSGFSEVLEARNAAEEKDGDVSDVQVNLETMKLVATVNDGEEWTADVRGDHTLQELKRAANQISGGISTSTKSNESISIVAPTLVVSGGNRNDLRRKAMCEIIQERICEFLDGDTTSSFTMMKASSLYHHFMLFLILFNVLLVLLETMKDVTAVTGHGVFDAIEWISVFIFTAEFIARVFSAPANPKYHTGDDNRSLLCGCTMLGRVGIYLTSFFGFCDILSIFPSYLQLLFVAAGIPFDSTIFRLFRLVRIFELEHFLEAFTLLDDAFRSAKDHLAAAGLLAVIIWVGCSTLFYIFEHGSPLVEGAFANIPDSMYYVAVFLGGEWCHCDFTVPGKILCIWLVAAGIGLFGIPVGAIFDAFEEIIDTNVENAKKQRQADIMLQVNDIFDEFDTDGDGTVDSSEMKALIDSDPAFAAFLFRGSPTMKATSEKDQVAIIRRKFSDRTFTRIELFDIINNLADQGLRSPKRKNRRRQQQDVAQQSDDDCVV
jgi:hypothetical protein